MVEMAKKVLLIAPYFVPRRRVSALRPFRFAVHLREHGWSPTVLCLAAPGATPTDQERQLLQSVDVVSLEPPVDRSHLSGNQLGESGAPSALGALADRVLWAAVPVDTWWPYFLWELPSIHRIVRTVRPQALWVTADPWSGLFLGAHLAQRFGLPWIADLRDPWTLCRVKYTGKLPLVKRIDQWLEREVLYRADRVVFTAQTTADRYRQHYGDTFRSQVIYNGFDTALLADPVTFDQVDAVTRQPGEELHLGFFGRFRDSSPALSIIEALAATRRADPDAGRRVRVHSFAALSAEDSALADCQGVADAFVREAPVPPELALSTLRRFDVLLVSTDPRRDEIVPAKLFESLAAGRPVLALSGNPEIGQILGDTGCGQCLDPKSPDETARLLLRCVAARRQSAPLPIPYAPNPDRIMRFEAAQTTARLAGLLDDIISGKRGE